jgi:hypothetical protein
LFRQIEPVTIKQATKAWDCWIAREQRGLGGAGSRVPVPATVAQPPHRRLTSESRVHRACFERLGWTLRCPHGRRRARARTRRRYPRRARWLVNRPGRSVKVWTNCECSSAGFRGVSEPDCKRDLVTFGIGRTARELVGRIFFPLEAPIEDTELAFGRGDIESPFSKE